MTVTLSHSHGLATQVVGTDIVCQLLWFWSPVTASCNAIVSFPWHLFPKSETDPIIIICFSRFLEETNKSQTQTEKRTTMKVFISLFLTLFVSCAQGFMVVAPQARMPVSCRTNSWVRLGHRIEISHSSCISTFPLTDYSLVTLTRRNGSAHQPSQRMRRRGMPRRRCGRIDFLFEGPTKRTLRSGWSY